MFAHVFPHFYWVRVARVKNIWPRVTSGSPKRDPVRFGFLKTQEPRVKFRVGFGPDPALILTLQNYYILNCTNTYLPIKIIFMKSIGRGRLWIPDLRIMHVSFMQVICLYVAKKILTFCVCNVKVTKTLVQCTLKIPQHISINKLAVHIDYIRYVRMKMKHNKK